MEAADLLLKLKETIASPFAADVFKAIYLDPLVLQALNDPDTFKAVIDYCGQDASNWTPAGIGLAAAYPDMKKTSLLSIPLEPIPAELRQQVTALYQRVLLKDYTVSILAEAVSVALAMRERRRLTDSWDGLAKEITRNFGVGAFNHIHWQTPLAVLYGISPDVDALIQELKHLNGYLSAEEYSSLMLHILVSANYLDKEALADQSIELINSLPIADRSFALDWLEQHGYDPLAETVAQHLTTDLYLNKEINPAGQAFVLDPLESNQIFERLASIHKQVKVIDYQKNTPIKEALLQEEENLLKQAEAIVIANKVASNISTSHTADWKKVVDLIPDSDLAKAQYALAMIQSDDLSQLYTLTFGNSYHPLVLAVKAYLAFKQGNMVETDLFMDHLTSAMQSNPSINRTTANRIVDLVGQIDLPGKVEQVLKALPYGMPAQDSVMRALARQLFKAGKYPEARQFAEATLLLNENDLDSKRLLAKSHEKEGDDQIAMKIWDDLISHSITPVNDDQRSFASCAVRCGQPERAIDTCKAIIENNPMDGSSYILLGDAYQQTGSYAQARDSYEKAVAIAPEMEDSWTRLVNYHLANKERDKALEILATAIKAVPNSAVLHYQLGCQYSEEDANSEAIQQFAQAYSIDPKNQEYIKALGKSYTSTGLWDEAEEIYRKAAKQYPFDQNILRSFGQVLLKQNKKDEALSTYRDLVDLHPAEVEVYLELSRLVVEDLTGGIGSPAATDENQIEILGFTRDTLEGAMDRTPQNWVLQLYLAEVLAKLNEREQSRDYFILLSEHIIEMPLDYRWRVNYGLGLSSGELGDYEVALAALQEAANQNPTSFQIHQQLAEAYLRANLAQSAVQAAQQALSINPKDSENLIWYAEFCTRSNELPEALSTLDALLKIQPDNIDLRIKLGSLQLKTNLVDQAKETFRKLLSDNKMRAIHYQQIGQHLASAGEFSEAIGFLKLGIQAEPQASLPLLLDLVQYEQKSGDISSALQTVEQAIGLDPQNVKLQVVKADMLAFAKDYETAIQTLELSLGSLPQTADENSAVQMLANQQLYEIYLRLTYLYRKTGALIQSESFAQKCQTVQDGDPEAGYLLADLEFNQLRYAEAQQSLKNVSPDLSDFGKLAELAGMLQVMAYHENNDTVAGRKIFEKLNLGSRWYMWKSALDIVTLDRSKLDLKTAEAMRHELDGLGLADLMQLVPSRELKFHILPNLPVYDPMTFSPTLGLIIAMAAAQCGGFETAQSILDSLRDQFPYEVSPVFAIARVYTIQAEQQRILEKTKVCKHLPASDSLSLGSYETFEEMILATERISSAEVVEDWHKRGTAAFYPTIDNFNAMLDRAAYKLNSPATIWKLSLENKVAEISTYLDQIQADVEARSLAAILITDKAPNEALEMIQPVVDFLAVQPYCLAAYAITASNAGLLEPALDTIENALAIWNDEPEWHILAARLSIQLNNAPAALHHLKIAADLQPENFSYAMEMGDGAAKFGDFMQAIQYYRKAAHIDPVNAQPWYAIAKAYQASGDLNQAVASIERSVTLAPDKAEPQILSAEFSLEAGKPQDALKKIDSALRIDPKNVDALSVKARALMTAGQADEALSLIQHSLKKVSNALPLLLTRADITREKEGPKAYLKSLHEIAADYPKDTRVLQLYAQSLAENGQAEDALHITQLALKNDANLVDMHILAGRLLRSTGQLDQAIDHFSACLNLDNTYTEAYLEMARTYQERRDFSKATTVYQKAIEMAPGDFRGYYQLGLLLRDAKDYRGAETMLRKASELSKDDVNILRQLGAIIALNLVHNSQEASVQS
jgi:tetratricopeptide (TPR) repeat protein